MKKYIVRLNQDENVDKLNKSINCNLCNVEMINVHETHNPYPLCDENDHESRCCTNCNSTKVIPARLQRMFLFKR
jgi:hypothetical protein